MIVKIVPSIDQIVSDTQAALNAFEDLDHDLETAVEVASLHLKQLLAYLKAVNCANNVYADFRRDGSQVSIELKGFLDKDNRVKTANLKAAEVLPLHVV